MPPARWTLTALHSWNKSSYNGTHYTWPRIPTSSAQPVFVSKWYHISLFLSTYFFICLISQYSILTTTNEHIINIDRQAIKKGHLQNKHPTYT